MTPTETTLVLGIVLLAVLLAIAVGGNADLARENRRLRRRLHPAGQRSVRR